MRTAAPVVSDRQAGGDLLWRPFADALPPERADVLVGNPVAGTLLDIHQRSGSRMLRSAPRGKVLSDGIVCAALARGGEWWMLLPHVGPGTV